MRLLAPLCFLLLLGLSGCLHDEADRTPKIPAAPQPEYTPRQRAEFRVVLDIGRAQSAERDTRPGMGPEDTIAYWHVSSPTKARYYRYANVHVLRRDIKHRWDSLKAVGSTFPYDTTYHPLPLHPDSTATFTPQ